MKSRIWLIPDNDFNTLVAESNSIFVILRKLGLSKSGFNTVVARIEQHGLDTCSSGILTSAVSMPPSRKHEK